MRLFAEHGVAGTSIRDVAAEAGVSPSLVVHHFRSKDGLKAAVDERATAMFVDLLGDLTIDDDRAEVAQALWAALGDEPDLAGYLRRVLIDGGEAAQTLFGTMIDATTAELDALERRGTVTHTDDPRTRAAFLLVNDFGVLILRDLVEDAIGTDPLGREGLQRWSEVALEIYTHGMYTAPPSEAG